MTATLAPSIAYKFLGPGREPCHGGSGAWPEPGLWTPKIDRLVPCRRGYHVCGPHQLLDWLGPEAWRLEWRGESVDAGDKLVVGEARLIERLVAWDARSARLFACDCAERVVRLTGPDERCIDAIAVARRFANGEATAEEMIAAEGAVRGAAGAAALAAALAAAWGAVRDAVRDAAGAATLAAAGAAAGGAAGDAAWDAAGDAAWAAARGAAGDAAWGAGWDAARGAGWDAARGAAWDAAWDAERSWQSARLRETLGLREMAA